MEQVMYLVSKLLEVNSSVLADGGDAGPKGCGGSGGSIYIKARKMFEGISWNSEKTFIAYVAEESDLQKPTFTGFGFKKEGATDKDCGSWKGQGDWEEDWGETYSGKRQPALFVIDINRNGSLTLHL